MQSANEKLRDVSEHRVQLCMLALEKLQGYWPPLAWNYRLFIRIVETIRDKVGKNSASSLPMNDSTTPAVDSTSFMSFSLDGLLMNAEFTDSSLTFQDNSSEPQNYNFVEDIT